MFQKKGTEVNSGIPGEISLEFRKKVLDKDEHTGVE